MGALELVHEVDNSSTKEWGRLSRPLGGGSKILGKFRKWVVPCDWSLGWEE